jgi:hypothetical protein
MPSPAASRASPSRRSSASTGWWRPTSRSSGPPSQSSRGRGRTYT